MESKRSSKRLFLFSKDDRLRSKDDFAYLKTDSIKFQSDGMVIFFKQHPLISKKIGISVSAKVGNSVVRNKIKRLIRNYFRLNKANFLNFHYLFVVTKPNPELVESSMRLFVNRLQAKFSKHKVS